MDVFTKLPYISLLVHEKLWLEDRKNELSDHPDDFESKYLYKDQISIHNMCFTEKSNPNISEMELDSDKISNDNIDSSLTKLIELDNVECYEYDPDVLESPLSPDAECLGRNSKIGLDVWKWSRESTPLGYSPPLCTCKNINMLYQNLITIQNSNYHIIEQYNTCTDENCSGLLYIPYSLIEVPLNRKIDNAMSFTNYVKIPDNTDIYCGNLKHTLVLCIINLQHEKQCLNAIKEAGIEHYLIYDVINRYTIIPFFTPIPHDNIEMIEKDTSTESKALTLLLDDGDDIHSQTAISGQYLVTIHRLDNDKLAISKVLKNQYGEFKPLDQYFFENLNRSLELNNDNRNYNSIQNTNINDDMILDTTSIKCNMLDCFSKERRPLDLQLRYNSTSVFDTIENIIGLSKNDLSTSEKPLKIDIETKHCIIGNLYKLGLSAQLNNEI